jgi:hypothetical protein
MPPARSEVPAWAGKLIAAMEQAASAMLTPRRSRVSDNTEQLKKGSPVKERNIAPGV